MAHSDCQTWKISLEQVTKKIIILTAAGAAWNTIFSFAVKFSYTKKHDKEENVTSAPTPSNDIEFFELEMLTWSQPIRIRIALRTV